MRQHGGKQNTHEDDMHLKSSKVLGVERICILIIDAHHHETTRPGTA